MKTIWNGITKENPVFILMLGLCPTLALTTNFEQAYLMGLCVLLIVTVSNFVISMIRKLVSDNVRTPVYILIIATIVTVIEVMLQTYLPSLHDIFGIYLPLITVNCIVLGRAINVASKEKVIKSICDGIGVGLGFTLALSLIGLIREVIGNNTITLMNQLSSITGYRAVYNIFPDNNILPISFLITPAGAFFTLGLLLALFQYLQQRKGGKQV